jgi:segregation and condensation protein A
VDLMRELDLDIAGEFLVMASTLMYIKSRELLPKDQQVVVEGEEEGEDPRWELIRQLVEYKKFKDAAGRLQEMEHAQENVYRRTAPKLEFEAPAQRVQVSIFDLVNAVNVILKRFATADSRDIFEDKWTVSEKIEAIATLIRERPAVKFSELFAAATSRTEVVVTFLAMLELIRLKQIVITQPEAFAEIEIAQAPPSPVAPPPEPPTETAPAPAAELNLRMN